MNKYTGFIKFQAGPTYRISDGRVTERGLAFDTGEANYSYFIQLQPAPENGPHGVKGHWHQNGQKRGPILGVIFHEDEEVTITGSWIEDGEEWRFFAELSPN